MRNRSIPKRLLPAVSSMIVFSLLVLFVSFPFGSCMSDAGDSWNTAATSSSITSSSGGGNSWYGPPPNNEQDQEDNVPPPPQQQQQQQPEPSASSNYYGGGDPTTPYNNRNNNMESSYEQQQQQQQRYDQPPPSSNNERGPPPSSFDDPSFPRRGAPPPLPARDEQQAPPTLPKTPIHYDFPVSNFDDNNVNNDQHAEFASPRQDLITRYMMTQSGTLQVRTSSTIIGGSIGIFLAKSVVPIGASLLGSICALAFLLGTFFRTPFGELTRAFGLSIILVLQRTSRIRRTYPTWRHVPACLGIAQRNRPPFPPARNPWRYTPRGGDPEFNMMYSIIVMAFCGSACGGTVPIIPTSMGALAGAALFASGCLAGSARGDLCRTMGMRVVALLEELWEIQAELRIIPKTAVVSSQVLDKLMIFDRKHKVKDRFLSLVTKGYEQVVSSRRDDMEDTNGTNEGEEARRGRRRPSEEEDDRRDGDRRQRRRDGPPPRRDDDRRRDDSPPRRTSTRPDRDDDRDDYDARRNADYNDEKEDTRDGRRSYREDEDTSMRSKRDDDTTGNMSKEENNKPKRGRFWR